jgi:hypothetical protein
MEEIFMAMIGCLADELVFVLLCCEPIVGHATPRKSHVIQTLLAQDLNGV